MAISPTAIEDLTRRGAEQGVDIRPGLALVEQRLQEAAASDQVLVEEAARWLIDAGGKRFRPMLVLLSGMLDGAPSDDPRLVDAAVIVELVHLSTLFHDDIIDGATVRRGAPAAHVRWSNTVAILTGDFLLARASELSAGLGVEVTRIMARTIGLLCQGEIREVQGSAAAGNHGAARLPQTRRHYLTVIGEKTASLISASCRLGALLGGQSADAIEALGTYGWHLGMAFQLADDLLDIAGDGGEAGKLPGTDLREGVYTLPVLLALEADGPGSPLAAAVADPDRAAEALALLGKHPALEQAGEAARAEAHRAKATLDGFAAGPVIDGLAWLADYAVDRIR